MFSVLAPARTSLDGRREFDEAVAAAERSLNPPMAGL